MRGFRPPRLPALFALLAIASLATACGPDYPSCDHDEDCHEGELCVDGQCQQCRTNTDCPTGQQCNAGRCDAIPGYCDGENPCPDGQRCENNRCVTEAASTSECDDARPCPAGQRCEAGSCVSAGPPPQVCGLQPVYFEFDSDALDSGDREALQAGARCMRERQLRNVHATGHADERGTEEYNMALSERRAQAVIRYLQSLGVGETRLTATGMGEEAATGTNEAAWRNDRRVDLHER